MVSLFKGKSDASFPKTPTREMVECEVVKMKGVSRPNKVEYREKRVVCVLLADKTVAQTRACVPRV